MNENSRKKFKRKWIRVEMPDGSKWDVPVMAVAMNRARYYADKDFNGDVERSLSMDTLPYFEDESEILDWARNNMNWSDVVGVAVKVDEPTKVDFEEGWVNGDAEIVERD